ncbi:hypothetical protein [Nocardia anaemiae]|uniref:hypothetical protein n=1 Tax=Nocardia anaemiae TaxID=263910 RepID=UPI000A64A305|nr:hypothetical protein [Nocardia anaemiae]
MVNWPSVEEQIASANAPRGSALESLIRGNQDFDLLDPREADDDIGLPPWLRVRWRKQHPDVEHSTINPGASYPDVLFMICEWIQAHPELPTFGPTAGGGTNAGES